MSLDSLLHFISSSGPDSSAGTDLAFAEVDPAGRVLSVNPFGRLAWGWRTGTQLDDHLRFALEALETDEPCELPIQAGGLHLRGMRVNHREGWFLIGHEAAALTGRPVLAELICPEDRWKLAELFELAAREGSSHAGVRFGREAHAGVLHVVQSVPDEFQALILPLAGQSGSPAQPLIPEPHYRSFLEQAPIGVLHLDTRGIVTFENHHFRSLVGAMPDDSWLGLPLEGIRRLDRQEAAPLMEAIRSGSPWSGQIALRVDADRRTTHHLRVHAAPILLPESGFIGSALFMEDRTDLIHGRQELAFIERTDRVKSGLRELTTEHAMPAVFRQAATRFLGQQAGASSVVLLGLSAIKDRLVEVAFWSGEESLEPGMSLPREAFGPMESRRFGRFLAPEEADACGLEPLGAEWWADPIHDNDQFAGYLLLQWSAGTRDDEWASSARINEWVRLFESLYSSLQTANRYRMTVSAIDDALFGFAFLPDRGRRFHFATEQIEDLTGVHPSELLREGTSAVDWMKDVIHPEDAPLVRAHHRTLQDGNESRVTYRIQHRDGSVRWLREHATPRTDATGLVAVNGILSDVSEQKAAECVLMQAKKEAEQSDRSKTAFIATMSHEIRTPLGAVNGFAQLLERELDEFEEELPGDLPAPVREFVSAIAERSQKLLALVHDLFELSNVEMGKATLQMTEHEAAGLIQQSVSRYQAEADEKGLVLRYADHQPSGVIRVDAKRFGQILDNLLSNAVKFTDLGTVDIVQRLEGSEMVVEVRDTGIGIAEENLERMFEPFSQEEDWRNRRFEGTGLGLALAGRLTGMMGGRIEAESEKGIGSIFRVRLPLVRPDRAPRTGSGWLTPEDWVALQAGGDGQSGLGV
ncbi:MAG: ATP-binding protein [Bacteroidetes bacterium]|nr:ATP-binding protein [Bacteroidota bacterium]